MNDNLKKQIRDGLNKKIVKLGLSQSEAARRIGVSPATITNIVNGKWDNISGAWLKVQNFVMEYLDTWNVAKTPNYLVVQNICFHAQAVGTSRAISFRAGSGKSFAAKDYANNSRNAFYICAMGDMSKRQMLKKLCRVMGLEYSYRIGDMLDDITEHIKTIQKPLIIIDEFDELDNRAMRIFKDIYNRCKCGFVLIGGMHLKKKIMRGVQNNRQSFNEIYSRLGREFYALNNNGGDAIQLICEANGIVEQETIERIIQIAKGDLRKVEHEIENIRLKALKKQLKNG